jgi:uncharacterized PurR-regulated membrane protein YhhQ (DUF165 family)
MPMILAVVAYTIAMTLANLSVAAFGPKVWLLAINSFLFIGLDLTIRDWLHVRLKWWQMLGLIVSTGLLTFVLNPAAGMIAIASSAAFTLAAAADWAVFSSMRGSWLGRANASNVAGALVDSLVFPVVAFGSIAVSPWMLAAKVAGGAFWAYVLRRSHALAHQ